MEFVQGRGYGTVIRSLLRTGGAPWFHVPAHISDTGECVHYLQAHAYTQTNTHTHSHVTHEGPHACVHRVHTDTQTVSAIKRFI